MEVLGFLAILIGLIFIASFSLGILWILCYAFVLIYGLLLPALAGLILGGFLLSSGADNLGVIVIIIGFMSDIPWINWKAKDALIEPLANFLIGKD